MKESVTSEGTGISSVCIHTSSLNYWSTITDTKYPDPRLILIL